MIISDLYDSDYNLWVSQTIALLRQRQFETIDWTNLIDEIEDMGKSQKRALESLLARLLEHLLKLSYWEEEKTRNSKHWRSEIVNFRYQINKRLQESPSLRPQLAVIYPEVLTIAVKSVSQLCELPPRVNLPLDKVLEDDWFPE